MPRPTGWTPYQNKRGVQVPGVTTILGRFKESGGLIHWSWNLAHGPLMECRELLGRLVQDGKHAPTMAAAKKFLRIPLEEFNYQSVRDTAADVGTAAHKLVEAHIRSTPVALDKADEPTKEAYNSYLEWTRLTKLKPEKAEVRLVSEVHQFGGMVDVVNIEKERCIIDWKSSNDVYQEYLMQVAAYRALWNENNPKKLVHVAHLVRFGKGEMAGSFDHRLFNQHQLDVAFEAFVVMRNLYEHMKKVKNVF